MRSAIKLRGRVAATAAAGAPASIHTPEGQLILTAPPRAPTRRALFFVPSTRTPNRGFSISCAGRRAGPAALPACYLLPPPVTSPVTAKPLIRHGLRGLLPSYRQTRPIDVRMCALAHAHYLLSLYGNIGNRDIYLYVAVTCTLPRLLPAPRPDGNTVTIPAASGGRLLGRNKIGGGYSPSPLQSADPHRPAGDGRRNFSGLRAIAAGLELLGLAAGERIQRGGGNGGFLRFFGARSAVVGTVALERSAEGAEIAAFSLHGRKLARLAQLAEGALAAELAEAGAAPPFAPTRAPSTLALDVFRISNRPAASPSTARDRAGSERAQTSASRMGSGVSASVAAAIGLRRAARANSGAGNGVGDGLSSVLRGHSEATPKLHPGGVHVNA